MTGAREAARAAESQPVMRVLARSGYAANGIVHALVGSIVIAISLGAEGEGDQAGAFKAIGAVPAGFVALWALSIALAALGVWHVLAAVVTRDPDLRRRWGVRISEGSQALVFLALAVIAGAVALGAKPDADAAARAASRGVLSVPGGPFVLGAAGLGIGIAGVVFVVMGVRRSYRSKVSVPPGALGAGIDLLGIVGFVAKGAALVAVGILVLVAAVKVDPEESGGLDGGISALLALPLGPLLVGAIGVGFIAYGVFCGFRARYARL